MKLLLLLYPLYLFISSQNIGAANKYSIGDLEALFEQESFEEMLNHMNDVSPKNRNKKWRDLLIKGTIAYANLSSSKDECGKAYGYLVDQLKSYPFLKKENTFLDAFSKHGICALKNDRYYRYETNKTGNNITSVDSRLSTLYKLSTETSYNKGFYQHILKNKTKYKEDKLVAYFIHFRLTSYLNLRTEKLGNIKNVKISDIKKLYDDYKITDHPKVKEYILERLNREYDNSIKSGRQMSKSDDTDNSIFLAKKYKLMNSRKLEKIIILKDKGFYSLVNKHPNDFKNNDRVIEIIVDDWEGNQPDDKENPILEELILKLNACKNEKYKEELFHIKNLKDDINRSIKRFDNPGGYHGELNNNLTVKEFKLAARCEGIPKKIHDDFLLLTFFYEIPFRDGKKTKPNALFHYSAEWLEKLSQKERSNLAKMVEEKDLHDLFHHFRWLEKDKAIQYMNYFPKLYSRAVIDCQYALKDDENGIKRKKKYRVSNKEVCELITKKD